MTPYSIKISETFQYGLKIHNGNAPLYNTRARTGGNCSPSATLPSMGSRKGSGFTPEASLDFMKTGKMWYAGEGKSSVSKTCMGKIPASPVEGGGHGVPCALLSRARSAFQGAAGEVGAEAQASWMSTLQDVLPTCASSPSAPRKSPWLRHRYKICDCRTDYFWPANPVSSAHLDARGFLKPTKRPRVSFTSTRAIPPHPAKLPCLGLCYKKLEFYGLTLQNLSPHLAA